MDSHASPATGEMAPWCLLVPLQTVTQLCTALYLGCCAMAPAELQPVQSPQMQRETRRGRDTHYIPFSCFFSNKSRNFIKTKSYMCRRHFSREEINTSHKHSRVDESHEKNSQYNQFSHKRNLYLHIDVYEKQTKHIC